NKQQSSLLHYYSECTSEDSQQHGRVSEHEDLPDTPISSAGKTSNSMETMLRDIKQSSSRIEEKINEVTTSISNMDKKMEMFTKRIDEAERWVGDAEDSIQVMETTVSDLQAKIESLQEKADDLENRSGRCNLRLVGLPEGEEGKDPVSFLEDWLPTFLNLPDQENKLEIERAHRNFAPKLKELNKPRRIIFKLLRFRDKELILKQARNLGVLTYKNKTIYLFPDISTNLFQRRKSFNGVKCLRKDLDIPFALLYTSRLCIDFKGKRLFFSSPQDAENHIKMASCRESSSPLREDRPCP
uniref:L1 transposable element RRM domain-containing protein n=1 Tax=Latimeria chalumnae TaxID=7897 RepID=H3AGT4_LATCH